METWKGIVTDQDESKVFEALADTKWDFRSVDAISKASGLPTDQVISILKKYDGELVRKSSIPDVNGRDLWTLKTDRKETLELLAKLRTFISKSIG